MSKSEINNVIKKHDLKSGDTMRNIHGDEIPGSVVIDNYTFVHPERDTKGFRMVSEKPLTGEQTERWLSVDAIRAFQSIKLD